MKRDIRQIIYMIGFIALVATALGYVFWSNDLIPDSLAKIAPGTLIGWIDDAMALLLMVFLLRKWRLAIKPGDKTAKKSLITWKTALIFGPIIVFALWYVFLGVDLIPDNSPFIGWIDDAVIILVGIGIAARIRQSIWPRGGK